MAFHNSYNSNSVQPDMLCPDPDLPDPILDSGLGTRYHGSVRVDCETETALTKTEIAVDLVVGKAREIDSRQSHGAVEVCWKETAVIRVQAGSEASSKAVRELAEYLVSAYFLTTEAVMARASCFALLMIALLCTGSAFENPGMVNFLPVHTPTTACQAAKRIAA